MALIYDSLVIIALLFLAMAVAIMVVSMILGAEAITEDKVLIENPFLFGWLIFCWYYYYTWCWRKSGQTLGMKAWRLRLIPESDQKISYKDAFIRFLTGLFGLANLWVFVKGKRGWHDILSKSNIVLIGKDD